VAILALYMVVQVAGLSAGWIALSWDPAIVAQHGSLGLAVGVLFGFCKLESRRHFRDARNAEEFRTRLGVAGDRIAGVATPDDQQLSAEEIIRLVFGPPDRAIGLLRLAELAEAYANAWQVTGGQHSDSGAGEYLTATSGYFDGRGIRTSFPRPVSGFRVSGPKGEPQVGSGHQKQSGGLH
jgi:hypothetical protein